MTLKYEEDEAANTSPSSCQQDDNLDSGDSDKVAECGSGTAGRDAVGGVAQLPLQLPSLFTLLKY